MITKIKVLIIASIFLLSDSTLKITVIDAMTNNALSNAHVEVHGEVKLTDSSGECEFAVTQNKSYLVITKKVGYIKSERYVNINEENEQRVIGLISFEDYENTLKLVRLYRETKSISKAKSLINNIKSIYSNFYREEGFQELILEEKLLEKIRKE